MFKGRKSRKTGGLAAFLLKKFFSQGEKCHAYRNNS
jgi:hypothetical protein